MISAGYKSAYQQGYNDAMRDFRKESKIDALDKIRVEIQENINYNKRMNYQGIVAGLLLALDILDKYKAESEDRE